MSEDQGFQVMDEVAVGDLTAVQQAITPVAQNVRVRIAKASVEKSKDGNLKTLKTELKIVDGIPALNEQTGEAEMKFQNKSLFPGFMELCVWANTAVKNTQWYKNQQHLLGFKQFCQALSIDIKDVKINDEFISSLLGRELLISIRHEEETAVNPETGKREKTGTLRERIGQFKKAE
jgi:hypothetical protein